MLRNEKKAKLVEFAGHGFRYGGSSSAIAMMQKKGREAAKLDEEAAAEAAGPDRYCLPRHPTHIESSCLVKWHPMTRQAASVWPSSRHVIQRISTSRVLS